MDRWIALLRGINLGPARRVSMPDLRAALTDAGYEDVRTLLQSGNVVLSADTTEAALAAAVQAAVEQRCGVADVAVVVRTRKQLAAAVERNPLPEATAQPKLLQVSFCPAKPPAAVIRRLSAMDLGDERVAFRGREIYAFHADGIQRSPLARALADKRLGVVATARNWSTVTKLLQLAGD